ncbi:hypothetical protein HY357_02250 [Candidatus Roizmanbacteria bacterium]|nr:hypothetical protein [Candidatus Roizmanbacteria bacterium]
MHRLPFLIGTVIVIIAVIAFISNPTRAAANYRCQEYVYSNNTCTQAESPVGSPWCYSDDSTDSCEVASLGTWGRIKCVSDASCVVASTPTPGDQGDNGQDIQNALDPNVKGKINQPCNTRGIELQPWKIPKPKTSSLLDTAIGLILEPINSFLGIFDPIRKSFLDMTKSSFTLPFCAEGVPNNPKYNPEKHPEESCTCVDPDDFEIAMLCAGIESTDEATECAECSKHGVWTAIGCIDFKLSVAIRDTIFGLGVSLAGIIALLCIIYSAFILQTSQGNPERIKKAQELLTSCIMGLMLIIFSVFILRLIGVDILKIPGFGR